MGLLTRKTRGDQIHQTAGRRPDPGTITLRLTRHEWVFISQGRIWHTRKNHEESVLLAGASIEANSSGQLAHHFSGAGALAFGVLGASRRTDTRKLFLVVQGEDGAFVIDLAPQFHAAAVTFAAKAGVLARRPVRRV